MAKDPSVVSLSCTNLGGEENIKRVIDIDRCLREKGMDNLESLDINGLYMLGTRASFH